MGILLALAGLALVGGVISGIGNVMQGQQEASKAELEAQKQRESIPILQAQVRAMEADRKAAGERLTLQQRALAIQEIQTARQGAEATSSVAASAGAGNLGGASPLRRARALERQTQLGLTQISGQRREAEIGYEQIARDIQTRTLATEYDIRWAGLGAGQLEEEADFARTYGWLSGLGSMLGAGGSTLSLFRK